MTISFDGIRGWSLVLGNADGTLQYILLNTHRSSVKLL